jgi:hypothetical protein
LLDPDRINAGQSEQKAPQRGLIRSRISEVRRQWFRGSR